jgi:hypothetical protein
MLWRHGSCGGTEQQPRRLRPPLSHTVLWVEFALGKASIGDAGSGDGAAKVRMVSAAGADVITVSCEHLDIEASRAMLRMASVVVERCVPGALPSGSCQFAL